MANDFDEFPLDDPIIDDNGKMVFSNTWRGSMSTFYQNLIDYLTQYGILVPKITTVQRDSIQEPEDGQMIYNTTVKKFQGRENGAWVNFI